jgi:two-component system chemotaxis sensor kinase CheA
MQELINTFLEEASDLISELEEALLTLETNPQDMDAINRVFRVMHTLKGSGSMFGYESVSNFTHTLENLYEKIRGGDMNVSTEIFNITLKSLDHIKALFEAKGNPSEEELNTGKQLMKKISLLTNEESESSPADVASPPTPDQGDKKSYYIDFKPNSDIMLNGTNPLYLIDELAELGDLKVLLKPEAIPEIHNLQPEKCYVSWEFILATEADHSEIVDVFIFVDDEAKITIEKICDSNILAIDGFDLLLENAKAGTESLSMITLQNFCKESKEQTENRGNETEKQENKEEKQEAQTPDLKTNITKQNKIVSSIRVSSLKIEELMNLVSELVTNQASLELYASRTGDTDLINAVEKTKKLIRQLRDNALDISLIPISQLTTRFKRLVRDLSVELKKEINFVTHGTETELDKAIIDQLAEPLMHIFRNAIDHGIESPEERKQAGKPAAGKVEMTAYYSGSNVVIEITDDGRGINPDKIRASAIEKGIITGEENLSREETISLIFAPGFSTASTISEISGRGVGMDVVRRKITDLQGEVKIESTTGKGSKFIIQIPLTLSIIDGLLFEVGKSQYIIGIQAIKKIYRTTKPEMESVFNNMVTLDGKQYPVIDLRSHFRLDDEPPYSMQIVLTKQENNMVAILVDKVVKEIQAVVKPISGRKTREELISGAAIMGDGSIALVLNTNVILNKYT